MKQFFLPILLTGLFVMGCGNYVTQSELDTTANTLRADLSTETDTAVALAHECSMSKSYIDGAARACLFARMQGQNPEEAVVCVLVATWQEHCIATNEEGNLERPRESVLDALDAVVEAAEAAEEQSDEN